MLALECLTKSYGTLTAVNDLSLTVGRGELFAFLGPNGAGKTTTLRMIAGLVEPDAGRITIDGIDLARDPLAAKRITGYVPDRPYLYGKLTAREFLAFIGGLYGIDPAVVAERSAHWCAQFRLAGWEDRLLEQYSHGMRQKVVLAAALLIAPRLLVLDEPMVGLDPHAARLVKDLLRDFCRSGGAVLLSTHSLEVAEEICTRLGIIHHGQLVASGTPAALRATAGNDRARLEQIFLHCTEEESS